MLPSIPQKALLFSILYISVDFLLFIGDAVNVQWSSNTGPHSCNFSIEWLKKYDYASPDLHEERRKEEEPLVAVCVQSSASY